MYKHYASWKLVWGTWPSFYSVLTVQPARWIVLCSRGSLMLMNSCALGRGKSVKGWTNWKAYLLNIIWSDSEISLQLYQQVEREIEYILGWKGTFMAIFYSSFCVNTLRFFWDKLAKLKTVKALMFIINILFNFVHLQYLIKLETVKSISS